MLLKKKLKVKKYLFISTRLAPKLPEMKRYKNNVIPNILLHNKTNIKGKKV